MEAGAEAAALTSMQALPDGRLVALGAGWPSELQYTVWHYFRMESKDHGATWSEREPFCPRLPAPCKAFARACVRRRLSHPSHM